MSKTKEGVPGSSVLKNSHANAKAQGMRVLSLGWEGPLGRKWQPIPVFLPGKSNGQRSLVGYGITKSWM